MSVQPQTRHVATGVTSLGASSTIGGNWISPVPSQMAHAPVSIRVMAGRPPTLLTIARGVNAAPVTSRTGHTIGVAVDLLLRGRGVAHDATAPTRTISRSNARSSSRRATASSRLSSWPRYF
jgi:hypothetical protein